MLLYILRDDSRCVFRDIKKHESFGLHQQAISNETVKGEKRDYDSTARNVGFQSVGLPIAN